MRRDLLEEGLMPIREAYNYDPRQRHTWVIPAYYEAVHQHILILTFGHITRIFGGYHEILGSGRITFTRSTSN